MREFDCRPVLLSAAMFCSMLTAPVHATEHDTGAWTIFTTTDSISRDGAATRWRYWFDGQARFFDIGSDATQYVLRPGIGYDVNDNMTVWAGFARLYSHAGNGRKSTESRYWQQLSWTARRTDDASLGMRLRLEQREVSVSSDIAVVLRYQLKYLKKLNKSNNLDLILAIEPFLDLKDTDWSGDAGPAQNRSFVGVGWRRGDVFAFETGYMNQYVWRDGGENLANHFAVLNVKAQF